MRIRDKKNSRYTKFLLQSELSVRWLNSLDDSITPRKKAFFIQPFNHELDIDKRTIFWWKSNGGIDIDGLKINQFRVKKQRMKHIKKKTVDIKRPK